MAVAADGNPDLRVGESREEPTPDNAGGNRVVIDIGHGRFAVYPHLQQGSISVHQGDASNAVVTSPTWVALAPPVVRTCISK